MSKYRRAAKIDANQPEMVRMLRQIPGVTVETRHDDILCGYKGKTYWYEIKEPGCVSPKTGKVRASELKPEQKKLIVTWAGHYEVIWNIGQILQDLEIAEAGL